VPDRNLLPGTSSVASDPLRAAWGSSCAAIRPRLTSRPAQGSGSAHCWGCPPRSS